MLIQFNEQNASPLERLTAWFLISPLERGLRGVFLYLLLQLICIPSSYADTTSHNLYDANGYLVSACSNKGCGYQIYKGLSHVEEIINNSN